MLYPNTDLWDLFETSVSQQHNISISGGGEHVKFYNSFNFLDNPGVVENAGSSRKSLRSNLDIEVTDWLKVGTQLSGYVSDTDPGNAVLSTLFTHVTQTSPGMCWRADDGRYGGANNSEDYSTIASNNPLHRLNSTAADIGANQLKARVFAEITPLEGLTINGSYSYEYKNSYTRNKIPIYNESWNFLTDTVVAGGDGQSSVQELDTRIFRDFMDGTIGTATAAGGRSEWAMNSYFSRLNLNWDDKYLFEANFRADGSSRFTDGNRWGYFPSVSAAWRINQENFMQNASWLDNLKLRASYGSLGNNSIGNYTAQSVYEAANYVLNSDPVQGLIYYNIANSNVSWETTTMANLAVDFGVLSNRLFGTIEYFNKYTDGILTKLPAALMHGTSGLPMTNAAEVSNNGIEVALNWNDNIGNDFSYSVGVNGTYLKNEVTKYKGEGVASYDMDRLSTTAYTKIEEGSPINVFYMTEYDRIIQNDADLALVKQIVDSAPDGVTPFPNGTNINF